MKSKYHIVGRIVTLAPAFFLTFVTFFSLTAKAQSVSEIKADNSYIYGEGWGSTLRQADHAALEDLTSKITISVSSSGFTELSNVEVNDSVRSKVSVEKLIKTYSQATLTNTQRILINNEPNAQVLRFIRASEIDRIFEGRKIKVKDMVGLAERAEGKAKIDDALRYYYWAFSLLKSIRYPNEVRYLCPDGIERSLSTWIPDQINEIFSNLKIRATGISGSEVQLDITYNGRPVTSFDYTYFDGMDWSNIYSAQDGRGVIELRPGQPTDNLRIKCEYAFEGQAHIDREIESVITLVDGTPFKNAFITVTGTTKQVPATAVKLVKASTGTGMMSTGAIRTAAGHSPVVVGNASQRSVVGEASKLCEVGNASQRSITDYKPYINVVKSIARGIDKKDYSVVSEHFTLKGMEQFDKLINYGRASMLGSANIRFSQLGDKLICRGLTMAFAFRNNNRRFVENVVFVFDKDRKIDEVKFGLGEEAYSDIMQKGAWSEDARLILADFLEDYKTAYAMKDIDFVRNVFDDNAIIITGRVTRKPLMSRDGSQYYDNKAIKLTRQSKQEYLRNLAHCFAGNEFINIRFANNDIIKSGKGGETYGIQIKQDYYSSTYGDTGYLFLMIDVNDPDNPVIKVRTWQPEPDPDFGIIGISDF